MVEQTWLLWMPQTTSKEEIICPNAGKNHPEIALSCVTSLVLRVVLPEIMAAFWNKASGNTNP